MPLSNPKLRGQDARSQSFSRLHAIVFLVFVAGLLAGDKPAPDEGFAPPEHFSREQREHWAYQPVKRTEPPAVKETGWIKNPIDRFILAEIEKLGVAHSPQADRVALIRRVTFDLTGLPPSPDQVAAFVGDSRPDAYERLVDRLLASPHYGDAGASTGSTWLITPIPTVSSSTPNALTPGAIATGS